MQSRRLTLLRSDLIVFISASLNSLFGKKEKDSLILLHVISAHRKEWSERHYPAFVIFVGFCKVQDEKI